MKPQTRDPKRLTDMIFVKRLERRLGRQLTEFELEDQEEPIAFYFQDGHIEQISIPRLRFPHDVITTVSDSLVVVNDMRRNKIAQGFYEETTRAGTVQNSDQRDAA